jgi:CRISPR-associated protein Csd2
MQYSVADTGKRFGTITGTMGRKNTVPYGLYRAHGFVNPFLARDTGFAAGDLELLWQALRGLMWEIDRSASRGLMATRGLYVFEHTSPLGNAPAHELFDRIVIKPFGDDPEPHVPRRFDDYKPRLTVIEANLPSGVTLQRMIG